MPVDILILAGIAVFVALRLRGVLGQDIGHRPPSENPYQKRTEKLEEDRVIKIEHARAGAQAAPDAVIEALKAAAKENVLDLTDVPDALKDDVRALHEADKQFEVQSFLEGAGAAFEMALQAYSKHDRATLKPLLSKGLYEQFCSDMDEQRKRGERSETTLLAILDVTLEAVELIKQTARITVFIRSEQVNVVRNTAGDIISGDSSDVDTVEDRWTFERDVRSQNPNWTLIAA